MNPLQDLQSDFQSFLLHGDEAMLARVTGTAKVSAQQRLAIYYDAYRLRLLEALDANYPVLHAWIGDEEFEQLGLAYLDAHQSTHFSIRYFGHRLPKFLTTEAYRDRPYFNEMATLEWALSEAFDAEDSDIMKIEDMAGIPPSAWPGMRFRFHSSVRRLNLRWNVPPIWKAINQNLDDENGASCRGETSATPSSSDGRHDKDEPSKMNVPALTADEYPQSWLIWREALKTYFRSLPVDEAWAIDTAVAGGTFAEICEGLVEWIDAQNVASHAAGLLKQWIADGLINKVNIQ
jgi:hypothetical protein